MYSTIVVGSDGSPTAGKAVAAAGQLAQTCDGVLHVVQAFRVGPPGAAMALAAETGMAMSLADWDREAESEVVRERESTGQRLKASGVKAETHAVPGNPVEAILEVAAQVEADVIVVGSKGMTGARRVLGSVPNSVAHRAPCAVLIVKTA